MVTTFIPARGDIVMMRFQPQSGREQAGTRPALVLTAKGYNERSGLMLACPVTRQSTGYPFEVPLPSSLRTHGVILVDHIKSVDWNTRGVRFIERASSGTLREVSDTLQKLLQM